MKRTDHGSATVHAMSVTIVLSVVGLFGFQVAMLIGVQHRVAGGADLAALAASKASFAGGDGCAAAVNVARRNHVKIKSCRMDFDVATVTARGQAKTVWGQRFAFERKARAAPIDYVEDS